MRELAGKTAFVTGAGSGIGLGISTALAQAGVKVMLCDIEQSALDAAVAGLAQTNADVDGVRADVSLRGELEAAAQATLERFGEVHILVNNAGVTGGGGYGAWDAAAWNWAIDVNLMAVIWGIEIFGPLIQRHGQGGHIVNTSSLAGMVSSTASAYNVTKYGVVALSEGLRLDLASTNIGVSVLCPGLIRTRILDSDRNLPERYADAQVSAKDPTVWFNTLRAGLAVGIDPFYVGELVREAIEEDWLYIFTDSEFEPYVDARFAAIKEGFDRIRDRVPRR